MYLEAVRLPATLPCSGAFRPGATGKTGVANSTRDGRAAVFYGTPDGSDDTVLSPEAFSERFGITAIINE